MKFRVLAIVPALALAILALTTPRTGFGAATCPSPAPSCSSSGTLSDFSGTFGCTDVITFTTGQVEVDMLKLVSDGAGNISGSVVSNSNNTGTTFTDFTAITAGATYCLNTDDTGYVFGVGGCPFALIVDDALGEVRLMHTAEGVAGALVCRLQ
jgi:hypothetical protein